jgi:hypothetical protein
MQVWCEDRYVGDLDVTLTPEQRHVELVQIDEDTLPSPFVSDYAASTIGGFLAPAFTRWLFKIEDMVARVEVDDFEAATQNMMITHVKRRYQVPDSARHRQTNVAATGRTRHEWLWQGIRVTKDQAERLFDHPSFEPV